MLNACAQSVYQVLFPSLGCATSCQNSSLTEGLCFLLFLLTGYSRYSQCKRKPSAPKLSRISLMAMCGIQEDTATYRPPSPLPIRSIPNCVLFTEMWLSRAKAITNIFPYEQRLYPAIEHIFVEVVMTYEQNDKKKNIKIAHRFPVEKSASSGPDYTTDFCLAVVELQEVNCYMHISALLLCATKQCMHKLLAS